ncbi:aldehyde dehydrogenase family protein [Phenylobacterium sp. LjRoot219]|uniref:aldehyde dehydrogenase family protein n=1 Tax=Phenylobacterium sp. LjRoot219 TaxID=3342283 RepID=UPI003ED12F92
MPLDQIGADAPAAVIPVFDPATAEQIAEVPDVGPRAVDAAVARARATFESGVWREMLPKHRAKVLWRVAEIVDRRIDEIVEVEARNNGMARWLARNLIASAAEVFRYYAGWVTKIHGQSTDIMAEGGISGANARYHAYTLKEPVGVAGLIIPWNGPFYGAMVKLAPALAAGCSCVLKPAEETPLTSLMLPEILAEAGVPDGVVNIITGYGETTGAALARHPDVDKIAFTGSTETGKLIVQAAAGNLKRVTLELGGKTPVLIYDDADLSKAVPGAGLGIFINAGQGCVCGSRLYVQRGVYDQVVEGLANFGKAMKLGGSDDPEAQVGPIISQRQLQRVSNLVEEGRVQGAEVVSGGRILDRPGYFFEPTVVTNVRPDMRMMQEEIFGPVIAVIPFDDEEEVIAEANNSTYGLAAGVWTREIARAHRLAKRLEAGTVWLNAQLAWDVSQPFGGYKQSGWGYEYGWEGLNAYLKTKTVYAEI